MNLQEVHIDDINMVAPAMHGSYVHATLEEEENLQMETHSDANTKCKADSILEIMDVGFKNEESNDLEFVSQTADMCKKLSLENKL